MGGPNPMPKCIAVDAEGEVLDVLVQSKRNKHAALRLMRKLLKKYAFAPERLVTDDLRSYSAAARELGIEPRHERGRWKNNRAENSHQPTRRRERKMQRFKPRNFFPLTPPSTTPSTSNAISPPQERTEPSGHRPFRHGAKSSPRRDYASDSDDATPDLRNLTTP